MTTDLRQLRYLVAVAEAGSITRAAAALYMTQPALTTAIRKLEHDVGVELLERTSRGVDLTPAGEAFLERAQLALEFIDEATRSARGIGANPGGEIVLGFLPATFSELPRELVSAFRAQHPRVSIRYRELSYITHTRDLHVGHVDLAFLWPPYDEPELEFQPLTQEPRVLGVADSHPLANRDNIALDQILDLPFPGFHPASSGGWFAAWFFDDRRGGPARTTEDETATPFEMALVVQEGRAIAPAAQSFANAFPSPGFHWLTLDDAPPATLALAWHRDNRKPATRAFVRTARAVTALRR